MDIDETDDNNGHIYRLKQNDNIQEILIVREINERNFVQNITEELILFV